MRTQKASFVFYKCLNPTYRGQRYKITKFHGKTNIEEWISHTYKKSSYGASVLRVGKSRSEYLEGKTLNDYSTRIIEIWCHVSHKGKGGAHSWVSIMVINCEGWSKLRNTSTFLHKYSDRGARKKRSSYKKNFWDGSRHRYPDASPSGPA